ncbi:MAG: hypothetical protein GEU75_08250 [Dehalococcoidia bacterium]|nr:hypothetical protein [Dehalococcoidia bacterium]
MVEILGRPASAEIESLHEEIISRWPGSRIEFVENPELATDGAHARGLDGVSYVHLRPGADDEVIYHELLHDLFYRMGCPYLGLPESATGGFPVLRDLIEIRVSHPYVHAEMTKRGFQRQEYWRRMEANILAWDQPESESPTVRFQNAAVVAEHIVSSPYDATAVRQHVEANYAVTWGLAERVEAIIRPAERTRSAWRRALVAMIALAQETLAAEGVDMPLNRVISVSPVFTATELKRTSRRLLEIEYIPATGLIALSDRRDASMLAFMEPSDSVAEAMRDLSGGLFLPAGTFLNEFGVEYLEDEVI